MKRRCLEPAQRSLSHGPHLTGCPISGPLSALSLAPGGICERLWSRRQAPRAFAGQWSHLNVLGFLAEWGRGCGSSTRDPRAGSSFCLPALRVPVTHAGTRVRGAAALALLIGSTPPSGSPSGTIPQRQRPCPLPRPGSRWRSWALSQALCVQLGSYPRTGAQPSGFLGGLELASPSPRSHQISYPVLTCLPESRAHTWSPCPSALSPACRKAVLPLCVKVQLSIRVLSSFAISL